MQNSHFRHESRRLRVRRGYREHELWVPWGRVKASVEKERGSLSPIMWGRGGGSPSTGAGAWAVGLQDWGPRLEGARPRAEQALERQWLNSAACWVADAPAPRSPPPGASRDWPPVSAFGCLSSRRKRGASRQDSAGQPSVLSLFPTLQIT